MEIKVVDDRKNIENDINQVFHKPLFEYENMVDKVKDFEDFLILNKIKFIVKSKNCFHYWLTVNYQMIEFWLSTDRFYVPIKDKYGQGIREAFKLVGFDKTLIIEMDRRKESNQCNLFGYLDGGLNYE